MNLMTVQLGWRTLLRDLRAGELRLLAVAVTLAVAALTSVAFFADRLQGGLQRDALQILGGDAVVASDNPTPEAFVQRAQALGLQTTAEGVETAQQLAFLRSQGCDQAQGYYFSRPQSAAALTPFLHQHCSAAPVGKALGIEPDARECGQNLQQTQV